MPRSGRLRTFIKEYRESPRFEKLSFILPFAILFVEGVLLAHALTIKAPDIMVVELTLILLVISVIEIIFVFGEMHEHYTQANFDRILTIRLDDYIMDYKFKNVKKIVEDFIKKYPEYSAKRNEIYHTTCQILETHREEAIEKELEERLKPFIKKKKKKTVDEIVETFVKKYPKYKNYRSEIYEKTCQIKATK